MNLIRIVEQLIGAAVTALILLYGSYKVMGEKVDTAISTMTTHMAMDVENQREVNKLIQKNSEAIIQHDTILRQQGLVK